MSLGQTTTGIEYPESDGEPLGETDVHIDWIIRLRDLLKMHYRDERVYVGSDMLLYYQEGDPSKFLVPDGFVVKDCDPGRRRTFRIWDEERTPNVAFEVTSASTRRDDTVIKPQRYALIGVPELFLCDPTGDYLDPPVTGYRLDSHGEYRKIEPDDAGELTSEQLDLRLGLDGFDLVLHDLTTGRRLLSEAEAERAARLAAEAELRRLRDQLDQQD